MSPTKGEGSSRHKGREVATYNSLIEVMGGKTPHSKSNRSKEEEGGRDPDSKCSPLINPWYDTHIHFSMVPSDYSPPLLGCVWLSLE